MFYEGVWGGPGVITDLVEWALIRRGKGKLCASYAEEKASTMTRIMVLYFSVTSNQQNLLCRLFSTLCLQTHINKNVFSDLEHTTQPVSLSAVE